jgi:hypothetical protein
MRRVFGEIFIVNLNDTRVSGAGQSSKWVGVGMGIQKRCHMRWVSAGSARYWLVRPWGRAGMPDGTTQERPSAMQAHEST